MSKIQTAVTLSRVHTNEDRDYVKLEVRDCNAGVTLFVMEFSFEDFGRLLTNEFLMNIPLEAVNLDKAGKTKFREVRLFKTNDDMKEWTRDEVIEHIKQNCQEPGWELVFSSSRDSVQYAGGNRVFYYDVVKWV